MPPTGCLFCNDNFLLFAHIFARYLSIHSISSDERFIHLLTSHKRASVPGKRKLIKLALPFPSSTNFITVSRGFASARPRCKFDYPVAEREEQETSRRSGGATAVISVWTAKNTKNSFILRLPTISFSWHNLVSWFISLGSVPPWEWQIFGLPSITWTC